jgi:y4mF family transcriptional regulator
MLIKSAKDLGDTIRKVRKQQGLTQPQLAGACGTGIRFIVDLEQGKATCELEKALWVAANLGIRLEAIEPPLIKAKNK